MFSAFKARTAPLVKSGANLTSATMSKATNLDNDQSIHNNTFNIKNEANISRSRNSRGNGYNFSLDNITSDSPTLSEMRRALVNNRLDSRGKIMLHSDSNGGNKLANSETQIEGLEAVQSRFARIDETKEREKSISVSSKSGFITACPRKQAAHSKHHHHHHHHQPPTPDTLFNLLRFVFAGHDDFQEITYDDNRSGSTLIEFTPCCIAEKHPKLTTEIVSESGLLPKKQNGQGHVKITRAYFERLSAGERKDNLQVSGGRNPSPEEIAAPTPTSTENVMQEAVTDHDDIEEIFRSILDSFELLSALNGYL